MTPAPQRTLLSWSTGKDSAWGLHLLRQDPAFHVEALVTSFNREAGRVAMHAVRRELAETQAERLGLPLWSVELPWPCSNEIYEKELHMVCRRAVENGITAIAFGDLFLHDIRDYRERQMASTGLVPLFPVWQIPTRELAREMIDSGVKAKITCIDLNKLDASYAGRDYDREFLQSLPAGIDPCGENGEFHTFVYDAPEFRGPIRVRSGERIERDGFVFADIVPS
jgi:uncharacterized protein (TIGR00290 family)